MNFYISNSIEQLDINEKNVELNDDMVEYLYSIKMIIPFTAFFKLDPYSDTIIEKEDIKDIILMCEYVINEQILNDYVGSKELIVVIREFNDLCCNAIKQCKKIVVIGD